MTKKKQVDVDRAAAMWASGVSATGIAERFGVSKGHIIQVAMQHRERFSPRRAPTSGRAKKTVAIAPQAIAREVETMRWVTQANAVVTLPKVSLLLQGRA